MPDYRVTWEIDIVADDPVAAARQALAQAKAPGSTANVFDVFDPAGEKHHVDLQEIDEGDDNKCRECGEPNDDGEGWDGLCGSCADKAEPKAYPVRLWATFRAICQTEIEATGPDDALEKAKALDFNDFRFEIEGDIEGDQTAHVDEPEEGDDSRAYPIELDRRQPGEPFSWEACKIVKKLAAIDINDDKALANIILDARAAIGEV